MPLNQSNAGASAWSNVSAFLAQPFSTSGDALQWFAFIGLILVSLYIWHAIARDWQRVEG